MTGEPRIVPRYVVGLVAGAVWVAVRQLVHAVGVPLSAYRQVWLFVDVGGIAGWSVLALRLGLYGLGAWGLWQGKPWARWLTMAYLAAELAVFVVRGAGGWEQFFSLHMILVPYATFGFMYLQRGADDFH